MHRSLDELAKLTRATAQVLLERSGRDPDANLAHLAELLAERAMALANEVIETKERADRMSTRFGPFLAAAARERGLLPNVDAGSQPEDCWVVIDAGGGEVCVAQRAGSITRAERIMVDRELATYPHLGELVVFGAPYDPDGRQDAFLAAPGSSLPGKKIGARIQEVREEPLYQVAGPLVKAGTCLFCGCRLPATTEGRDPQGCSNCGCSRHLQLRVGNPASFCLSCRSGVQHERTDACEAVPAVAGGPLPGEGHTYVPPALLGARGYCCACGEPREHPLHVDPA
jgi:hypothetical protein